MVSLSSLVEDLTTLDDMSTHEQMIVDRAVAHAEGKDFKALLGAYDSRSEDERRAQGDEQAAKDAKRLRAKIGGGM